ncbi:dual specificity protein phosphatase family protein [Phormidesmis sp. 146-12]
MSPYRFAAAGEQEAIVFGAARPGHSQQNVSEWLEFMRNQGIQRVCCLLPTAQLTPFSINLLEAYQQEFGTDRVCWSPIADFQLADRETLTQQILPFLKVADQQNEKVVVHCGGGIGRTGQVLAAWLVSGRGLPTRLAIATVKKMGRNPHEAAIVAPLRGQSPWKVMRELDTLLNQCGTEITP